jgi:hypothetical protein
MPHSCLPGPPTNPADVNEEPLEPLPAPAPEAQPEAPPTFRVGDYEIGDGYFSELSGHPDIVY